MVTCGLFAWTGLQPVAPAIAQGECDGAEIYVSDLHGLLDTLGAVNDFDEYDITSMTSEELNEFGDAFADAKSKLGGLTPPSAAMPFHTAFSELMGTFSQLFSSMATAGLFGALPYTDAIENLTAEADRTETDFENACNVVVFDDDDDGTPEVGVGSVRDSASSEAIPPTGNIGVGRREYPVPVATPYHVGNGWTLTVVGVNADAAEQDNSDAAGQIPALDQSSSAGQSEPTPPAGRQFLIVRVRASYMGEEPTEFGGRYRLRAVGDESVSYSIPDDSCGTIPDPLPDPEVFAGGTIEGNVCWAIRTTEAGTVVMYDALATVNDEDQQVFFSLKPPSTVVTPTP